MIRLLRRPFRNAVRNIDLGGLLDVVLVCTVGTILVIRLQLWATDYPQLAPAGNLHIAHMLWGGLFMLIALVLLLSMLGRSMRTFGAVLGGVGFGFFIDELGKFITADNDYFFRPTPALIYLLLLGFYFAANALQRRSLTPREYLINAMDLTMEAARHDLDANEKSRALAMLEKADPREPLVAPLRTLLHELDAMPAPQPSIFRRAAEWLRSRYITVVDERWFIQAVIAVFAVRALISIVMVILLIADHAGRLGFIRWVDIASTVVAAALTAIGIYLMQHSRRLEGYQMLDRALLVSIFVTQVFAFIESQFAAVFGLGANVALLVALRYMMRAERQALMSADSSPSRTPTVHDHTLDGRPGSLGGVPVR